MNKLFALFIFAFIIAFLSAETIHAQGNKDQSLSDGSQHHGYRYDKDGNLIVPPGMELQKVGVADLLLPKDTKINKVGNRIIPEVLSEYTARKLLDIEKYFEKIENEQKAFKEKIKDLEDSLGR